MMPSTWSRGWCLFYRLKTDFRWDQQKWKMIWPFKLNCWKNLLVKASLSVTLKKRDGWLHLWFLVSKFRVTFTECTTEARFAIIMFFKEMWCFKSKVESKSSKAFLQGSYTSSHKLCEVLKYALKKTNKLA